MVVYCSYFGQGEQQWEHLAPLLGVIALLESGIGNRSEGIVDCQRVFLGHAAQTGLINVLTLICSAIFIPIYHYYAGLPKKQFYSDN